MMNILVSECYYLRKGKMFFHFEFHEITVTLIAELAYQFLD